MCFEITLDKAMIPKIHLQSMEYDLFVHPWSCGFRINLFICAASRLQIKIQEFLLDVMLVTSFMAWFNKMHLLQLCQLVRVFWVFKEGRPAVQLPAPLVNFQEGGRGPFQRAGWTSVFVTKNLWQILPQTKGSNLLKWETIAQMGVVYHHGMFLCFFCIFHSGILGGNHLISPSLVFARHVPWFSRWRDAEPKYMF